MKNLIYLSLTLLIISCGNRDGPIISPNKPLVFETNEIPDTITSDSNITAILKDTADTNGWKRIRQIDVKERLTVFGQENKETRFKITTTYGVIKVKLYKSTPLHRANMILMIKQGLFNNTRFYRISQNFIIQAGFTDGPGAYERMRTIGQYKVPAEVNADKLPHVRGAFAMAGADLHPGKPRKKDSNPFTFYIVDGAIQSEASLGGIEETYGVTISESNKKKYMDKGGAPHLDDQYTVCGEVYSGMSVVEKISKVKTNSSDHPEERIYLTIDLIEN